MYKLLILTIIICWLQAPALAKFDFNDRCKQAYVHIISLRLESGKSLLEEEKKNNPGNDIPYYIENYIDFLTLTIGEEKSEYNSREKNKDIRLERLERGDVQSPYYLYTQAEVLLHWAFSRVKFGEYTAAAIEVYRSYKLLEKNSNKFPDFVPNKKSLGLLHALVGTIPDDYSFAVRLMGVEGTIEQGIGELKEVVKLAENDPAYAYLKAESLFLLGFLHLNFLNTDEGVGELMEMMNIEDNENLLLAYSCASIALKKGKAEDAIGILSKRPKGDIYFPFHYLEYLHGVALQSRLDPESSKYFQYFLDNFKGQNYIKAAWQRLAWNYLLEGDTVNYKMYIAKALSEGNSTTGEDSQAKKEAESGQIPHVNLLRARLLFDGGYYNRALDILLQKDQLKTYKRLQDKLELTYRLGRIYHQLGQLDKAIDKYRYAAEIGKELHYYYAANSLLKMGNIFEQREEFGNAKEKYQACIALKDHEYEESIEQKAKAGLNRIKGK